MSFGIAYSHKSNYPLGSMVEVAEVLKVYPGGDMDIVVRAVSLFRLDSFSFQKDGKLYPGGEAEVLDNIGRDAISEELKSAFHSYLLNSGSLKGPSYFRENPDLFDVANNLFMPEEDKLEWVNLENDKQRDHYLRNYIRYVEFLKMQEKNAYESFYLN